MKQRLDRNTSCSTADWIKTSIDTACISSYTLKCTSNAISEYAIKLRPKMKATKYMRGKFVRY
ncbi:hypothetical protein V8C43DRAFT_276670 [Trichoderma afarasin]